VHVLLKLLPLYAALLAAQLIFSWFNYTFLFAKIKSASYRLPFFYGVMFVNWIILSVLYYVIIPTKNGFRIFKPFLAEETFSSWWKLTVASWMFNAPAYILGTILVAWSIKMSMENFGVMYTSIIVGQIITVLCTVFFMWYKMGEFPNRNGWIAMVLILIASVFAAFSGKST